MRRLVLAAALAALASPAFAAGAAEQGRYQAVLGDCTACHGTNLTGGGVLETPFGKLAAPNITPDKATGIGNWTGAQFRQAMKTGVAPGGKLLYPAMPYPAYSHMRDSDVAALWAYLRTVKSVRNAVNVNQLRFPFNLRVVMRGWNLLFFRPVPFTANAAKSAAWNRGAYIVNGAAHCGVCHTPKTIFGSDKGVALGGASLAGWFAPDLTGDATTGLGGWRAGEIAEYLRTGRNARSIASGPMAEAVEHSTAHMTDADLGAIAVYLKDQPAAPGGGARALSGQDTRMKAGAALYQVNCAACHGGNGRGNRVLFPPLAGNAIAMQADPVTLIRAVLAGTRGAATRGAPTGPAMPGFAWRLDDGQVADVLTYVRGNWGNRAAPVPADAVRKIRAEPR